MAVRARARFALVLALMAALLAVPVRTLAQGESLADDPFADAIAVIWDDGSYHVEVTMEGGSGKASIASPAEVAVEDGKASAYVAWSSPNYDYMVVAGKTYLPINEEGNSVFLIPVLALDEPFPVVGDTTAMSVPHEIEYQLTFSSASVTAAGDAQGPGALPLVAVAAACGAAVVALLLRRGR